MNEPRLNVDLGIYASALRTTLPYMLQINLPEPTSPCIRRGGGWQQPSVDETRTQHQPVAQLSTVSLARPSPSLAPQCRRLDLPPQVDNTMASATSSTPFSVAGKTAIITGAASGIGYSFAELLVSKACNVVIADLGLRPEAERLVSEHSDRARSPRAVFCKTDVTSWAHLDRMFRVAVAEFGGFDIVCPGAGVYEPLWSSFWHPPGSPECKDGVDAGGYALLDINLTHPIRATQLALQHWLGSRETGADARRSGSSVDGPKRVVLISSIAAQVPALQAPLYVASKHAVSGFTRCLAELDPILGVRVTAVAPGVVKTPLWTDHPEKLFLLDRDKDEWVTPEQVARVMLDSMESEKVGGGTVLEVGAQRTRPVQVYNDPGPDFGPGGGMTVSNSAQGDEMIRTWLRDGRIWAVHDGAAE
ncbi:NAD(P)-binding domain protein [Metarhizium album ARSEF 1941]|uniref:Hydroxynaphthalene reductase-like protein Arp2 n=1 Tax=Metarhizium album (strain ARSEF 1941) TaxID=1081103 RepID=A0A0B2X553_METAS|nr:NAD(P)-binding domain protein [Metarhizium album ARSEF 1941]KHO01504.1 NAD(P)-binding domain protein [Metarhizium album ARSEF 1941]